MSSTSEEKLYCLNCQYDLTGLPEDHRCPECGEVFNRTELRQALFLPANPQPVYPWSEQYEFGTIISFLRTCWITFFNSTDFAKAFPRRHSALSGWTFSNICYALALFVGLFPQFLVPHKYYAGELALVLVLGFLACAVACETVLAAFLAFLLRPNRSVAERYRYHFWRGLLHFHSNYLVLSVMGFSLIYISLYTSNNWFSVVGLIGWALVVLAFSFWWLAILRCIATRARPGLSRLAIAALAIPLAAIGILYLVTCESLSVAVSFGLG